MVTINPDVVSRHAQHVHAFAEQLENAKNHTVHDGHWTEMALGGLGQAIFFAMDFKLSSLGDTMGALAQKGDGVEKRIDATAKAHHFAERANKDIMVNTKVKITDPDLFHPPTSINDLPDTGALIDGIGGFASNCPQYAQAGSIAVVLGAVGLGLDVLGFALDPVGGIFGAFAGLIVDLIYPVKELLDWTLGDPGALSAASQSFDQVARYLSECAHIYNSSLSEITDKVWNEPGASDVYLKAAANLIQLTITAGSGAEEVSGEIQLIGSVIASLRGSIFGHAMGFVTAALLEAAIGTAAAEVTFGASLAVAAGIIETEATLTIVAVCAEVAAALAKLGAATLVANAQAQNYQKLVADIKK